MTEFKNIYNQVRAVVLGRFIIVHAGSKDGFVENAALVFKAGQCTGDYHGQMNKENFIKWLTEKLLPNIQDNSVVVLDNAPYHSSLADKVPTKSSLKKDMVDWLSKKGTYLHLIELYQIDSLTKNK